MSAYAVQCTSLGLWHKVAASALPYSCAKRSAVACLQSKSEISAVWDSTGHARRVGHTEDISNVLCMVSCDHCDNRNVVFLQGEFYSLDNNFPFTRLDPAKSAISRAQMDGTIDLGRAMIPSSISSSLRRSLKWPQQAEVNWTNVHKCAFFFRFTAETCDDTYMKHAWSSLRILIYCCPVQVMAASVGIRYIVCVLHCVVFLALA
jgi:hypothetical protein